MIKRNLVAILVAALGITAGAAAFANAQTGESPPTTTAPEGERRAPDGKGRHGGGHVAALGRAVHGDLIVRNRDGQFEEVTFDRGTLEAVDEAELTLARPDGEKVTLKLNGDTRYKGVESRDQLRTGDPAIVVSKDGVATLVGQRPEGAPERRRPGRAQPKTTQPEATQPS